MNERNTNGQFANRLRRIIRRAFGCAGFCLIVSWFSIVLVAQDQAPTNQDINETVAPLSDHEVEIQELEKSWKEKREQFERNMFEIMHAGDDAGFEFDVVLREAQAEALTFFGAETERLNEKIEEIRAAGIPVSARMQSLIDEFDGLAELKFRYIEALQLVSFQQTLVESFEADRDALRGKLMQDFDMAEDCDRRVQHLLEERQQLELELDAVAERLVVGEVRFIELQKRQDHAWELYEDAPGFLLEVLGSRSDDGIRVQALERLLVWFRAMPVDAQQTSGPMLINKLNIFRNDPAPKIREVAGSAISQLEATLKELPVTETKSDPSADPDADPLGDDSDTDPFGNSDSSDPFGNSDTSNPLGGGGDPSDPFRGGDSSDPFGDGGDSSDPFGGSDTTDPFGGGGDAGNWESTHWESKR